MRQIQNPTDEGRVLWNSLDGASVESPSLSGIRTQHLIAAHRVRPELAAIVAIFAFEGCAR